LIEVMLALAIAVTLSAVAIPELAQALDDLTAGAAARDLALQLARVRADAVRQSTFVGLRFTASGADYAYTVVTDGNRNGIRTADITSGVDRAAGPPDMLGWHFKGVRFGLAPGVPDADMATGTSTDGVRVGTSRILSMNPDGSSSSGTLYVAGRRGAQYAVRILAATGRVRVLKYDAAASRWETR
jgi:type II secretory pathway pseudopilin PulG